MWRVTTRKEEGNWNIGTKKMQELNPNTSENYMVNSICVSDVYWTVYHCDIWRIKTNKTKQLSCASAANLHTTLAEPHPNFNTAIQEQYSQWGGSTT